MWDEQVADLQPHLRVLRYDTRGHGASSAPAGSYDVASLAHDVLALADALQIDRFAFCGLSLGGMIGQWLGAHAADRVTHLVLANTSPRPDADLMEQRRRAVLDQGIATIGDVAMARFSRPSRCGKPAKGRMGSADAAGDIGTGICRVLRGHPRLGRTSHAARHPSPHADHRRRS